MAALLYASRVEECPFEIVLVASDNPEAAGLRLAAAEGVATVAVPRAGSTRAAHEKAIERALLGDVVRREKRAGGRVQIDSVPEAFGAHFERGGDAPERRAVQAARAAVLQVVECGPRDSRPVGELREIPSAALTERADIRAEPHAVVGHFRHGCPSA